jgi:MalT-like TPR region
LLAYDPDDIEACCRRLEQLAEGADPGTAVAASHWLSYLRENSGDPAGAAKAAERALELVGDDAGPWSWATPHAMLAELTMHMGDRTAAAEHARAALPVMQRLGASDDEIQLRALLVCCAIAEGRLREAEEQLAQIDKAASSWTVFGGAALQQVCRAELLLARGDHAAGLATYRDCAARMRELKFPGVSRTGLEPWALFGASMTLTAHAYYAADGDEAYARGLFRACRQDALNAIGPAPVDLDYPVTGLLLFGLGAWGLLRQAAAAEDAVRLLALADRFAYNRATPTLLWERIAPAAEAAAPGRIAGLHAQYSHRRPADLREEACRAVERLPG